MAARAVSPGSLGEAPDAAWMSSTTGQNVMPSPYEGHDPRRTEAVAGSRSSIS